MRSLARSLSVEACSPPLPIHAYACARSLRVLPGLLSAPGLLFTLQDPDGYLVEVLPQGEMITKPVDCAGVAVDGGEGYKDNSKA